MSRNLIFSRNFTISKPKDKVNYVLLGRANFLGNLARGGQISCDTGFPDSPFPVLKIAYEEL